MLLWGCLLGNPTNPEEDWFDPLRETEVSGLHFISLISPEKKDSTLHTVKEQHQEGPDSSGLHAQSDQAATKLKILKERESRNHHSYDSFPQVKVLPETWPETLPPRIGVRHASAC